MKTLLKTLAVFLMASIFSTVSAQISTPGPVIPVMYDPVYVGTQVLPPPSQPQAGPRSISIMVDYQGNWPAAAMAAFDFAVEIWENTLDSPSEIRVAATFEVLPNGVLGGAGPNSLWRNFDGDPPAYMDDTWFPDALADKLNNADLNPGNPDINTSFQSDFSWDPTLSWYFGTDGMAGPNELDFVTIVLHELGHGLGYGVNSATATNSGSAGGVGFGGFPTIWDRLVCDAAGTAIADYASPSVALGNALTGGALLWCGVEGIDANGGVNPPIFSPNPFQPGSSISHLDEASYPPGDPNSVMTPAIGTGEVNHVIGPVILGMLLDIGWMLHITTGIEDELVITSLGYENPYASQGGPLYFDTEIVSEGQNIHGTGTFWDEDPTGDWIVSANWTIDAYHGQGKHQFMGPAGAPVYFFETTGYLPFLLTSNWKRNSDGSVKAKLNLNGTDNDGVNHEDFWMIGIAYPPDQPQLDIDDPQCRRSTLSFYGRGAKKYLVYYDTDSGAPYNGTGLPQGDSPIVVEGSNSLTLTGLQIGQTYYFNVKAVNDFGTSPYGNEVSVDVNCEPCGVVALEAYTCLQENLFLDYSDVNMSTDNVTIKIMDRRGSREFASFSGATASNVVDLMTISSNIEFVEKNGQTINLDPGDYTALLIYDLCWRQHVEAADFTVLDSRSCGGEVAGKSRNDAGDKGLSLQTDHQLAVYPNPANEMLYYQIDEDLLATEGNLNLQVVDITGRPVMDRVVSNANSELNVQHLAAGVYIFKLSKENRTLGVSRFVIQH